mmetsp:Transcript_30282/g.87281  ORF Transcript_30282/g.87281 Transcript_30282/m.87281 type:complete len:131 (-) Transcript_30282:354-746(-)
MDPLGKSFGDTTANRNDRPSSPGSLVDLRQEIEVCKGLILRMFKLSVKIEHVLFGQDAMSTRFTNPILNQRLSSGGKAKSCRFIKAAVGGLVQKMIVEGTLNVRGAFENHRAKILVRRNDKKARRMAEEL